MIATAAITQHTYKEHMKIMGCLFDITVVADNQEQANYFIDTASKEMTRIENLISSWDTTSQTSEINRNAGIRSVSVDQELFDLIKRAITLSMVTDGAFDISYGSMDQLWTFNGTMTEMPDPLQIAQSVALVGYEMVHLRSEDTSVFLQEAGMKIGFGAIGKGYAADKAKALLIQLGCKGGIINASGDMNTWGRQANGEEWKIAITNPIVPDKSYGLLPMKKGAVVTSGNYKNFALINGKRYAHIIDPRTGMPTSGILSVTLFAPSAELADALATSVFVMGVDAGLDRINQLKDIDCIIVDDKGQLHHSENIKIKVQ